MRMIIDESKTIVALDTCVLGMYFDDENGEPGWHKTFVEMSKNGFEFCISDLASVEILKLFKSKSHEKDKIKNLISKISEFISKELPVLPGNCELFKMIGCNTCKETESDIQGYYNKVFDKIKYLAKNTGEIDYDEIENNFGNNRSDWIELIKEDSNIEIINIKTDDFYANDNFNVYPGCPLRLDLIKKYIAWRVQNRMDGWYNPQSKKRSNDGLDFSLLWNLILPAIVCMEESLCKDINNNIGSFQSSWIHTPGSLAKGYKEGKLIIPEWSK